jgi:hypothetical protein
MQNAIIAPMWSLAHSNNFRKVPIALFEKIDVVLKIVGRFIPFFMPPVPPQPPIHPQQPIDYARATEDAEVQRKIDLAVANALAAYKNKEQ